LLAATAPSTVRATSIWPVPETIVSVPGLDSAGYVENRFQRFTLSQQMKIGLATQALTLSIRSKPSEIFGFRTRVEYRNNSTHPSQRGLGNCNALNHHR
jgi:hypothetical protein